MRKKIKKDKPRILILAPHVDDTEFGLGVSIQRWLEERNATIFVVVFASGSYTRSDGEYVCGNRRSEEFQKGMNVLGVDLFSQCTSYLENDGYSWNYKMLVTDIERYVSNFSATEVYTCLPSFNQDHQVLYNATMTAFRLGLAEGVSLYAYEYPGNAWGPVPPSVGKKYVIASSEHKRKKLSALMCHKTQFHGRMGSGVDPVSAVRLMEQRGAEIECDFAEVHYVIREIV